jgi:hypothetical protein
VTSSFQPSAVSHQLETKEQTIAVSHQQELKANG